MLTTIPAMVTTGSFLWSFYITIVSSSLLVNLFRIIPVMLTTCLKMPFRQY